MMSSAIRARFLAPTERPLMYCKVFGVLETFPRFLRPASRRNFHRGPVDTLSIQRADVQSVVSVTGQLQFCP